MKFTQSHNDSVMYLREEHILGFSPVQKCRNGEWGYRIYTTSNDEFEHTQDTLEAALKVQAQAVRQLEEWHQTRAQRRARRLREHLETMKKRVMKWSRA